VRQSLIIMDKLECPKLIVMSGNVVPGLSPEAQHASCVEGMKRAAELVEGRALPCCWRTSTSKKIPLLHVVHP